MSDGASPQTEMTPERWHQVKDFLASAIGLPVEDRGEYVAKVCGSDSAMLAELESLIAAHEIAEGGGLEKPALDIASSEYFDSQTPGRWPRGRLPSSDEARSSFLQDSPFKVTLIAGNKLGDYEVQKLLGSGGMGEVYRARDLRLRRDVAIKVLPSFLSSDKERLRRFEQEAQAAAALNHPNILTVFQMGTYEGAPYLVSELLEGETLRGQISRGPMSARRAIDYGVQIAHGLAAAHEKGIVHRDLKPENLFSTKDGRIKILDFGLAKLRQPDGIRQHSAPSAEGNPTEPGTVMGTAGYMSPEQVRGQDVDQRTDVFAFGAILYEMVTGKRAFQKPTSVDTMSAILNEDPPPVSQLAAHVPPALQRTVHRCIEKSPEQRFQSASDLAFALEALSDSAASSSALRFEPAAKRAWRAGALAITVVLLTLALLLWWQIPAALPVIQGVRQLTDDAEPKLNPSGNILVTDGPRVYFTEGTVDSLRAVQVSSTGGQTSLVPTRLDGAAVCDIVPDASALLLAPFWDPRGWIQPLPSGEPRSVNLGSNGSRFLSDERIVVADRDSLYIANTDGSDHRKIVEVPGLAFGPAVSPDGKRIRFTLIDNRLLSAIWEVHLDGTALQQIRMTQLPTTLEQIAGVWTRDGKYFLFQVFHGGRWDLWAMPESNGVLHRSAPPIQLTNGPLSYEDPVGSRDGKQIFAIGSKKRGELIRYNAKSRQFVPYLDGISAVESRVSPDGKWILYVSYPDHTLWRSRGDGSDRVQLTFPPMLVFYPEISPDGRKIAFDGLTVSGLWVYLLNMEGGTPEKVVENGHEPTWSPDGNSLAYAVLAPGSHFYDTRHWIDIQILDLRTKRISVVPNQRERYGPWWPQPNKLVTTASDVGDSLAVFDFTTQKWSKFGEGIDVSDISRSRNGKYLYILSSKSPEGQKVRRIRASDLQIEVVADIAGLRLVSDDSLENASSGEWLGLAPDDSPTLTHDIGSDEIYALDVKWP